VSALLRSELLKLRTTRSWWGYLGVIVLLGGLAAAGSVGSAEDARRSQPEFRLELVDNGGFAFLIALVLGITVITGEFRHGTITPTLLAAPRRERVLAAKAGATALVSLLFVLLTLAVIAAVALPWLSLLDAETALGSAELERAAQVALATVLWGLMGLAIGTLVQNQVAALVGSLVWLFIVETLVLGLAGWLDVESVAEYLPFRALDAADGTGADGLLSYGPGVAVSVAWIAAVLAAGLVRTQRADVT
jgi:ABC-2 type transport system permease protein